MVVLSACETDAGEVKTEIGVFGFDAGAMDRFTGLSERFAHPYPASLV